MEFPLRINKYLAYKNIASRREADTLVANGQVMVNGRKATLGQKVEATDTVEIVGQTKTLQYLAYYKGRGIITHSPDSTETDIATRLERDYGLRNVYPIGRLDKDSEGLMILTNDGRITAPLLNPDNNYPKVYEVTVDKALTGAVLKQLESGVNIEGYTTKKAVALKHGSHSFRLTITEGKKHQIRRMCAALGYQVQYLKRVQILDIKLGALKPNQYRKLTEAEIKELLNTLKV